MLTLSIIAERKYVCLFCCASLNKKNVIPVNVIVRIHPETGSCDDASTHDAYENTWKCGELELHFPSSAGG